MWIRDIQKSSIRNCLTCHCLSVKVVWRMHDNDIGCLLFTKINFNDRTVHATDRYYDSYHIRTIFGRMYYLTRIWNMISSNSVSWTEIWEFLKSQRDIMNAVTISKIIVFEIIWYVAYYSAAKFTLTNEKPCNKATKCGIRRSWKVKVKRNLGCCITIAITISYISVFFHLPNPKIDRVTAV